MENCFASYVSSSACWNFIDPLTIHWSSKSFCSSPSRSQNIFDQTMCSLWIRHWLFWPRDEGSRFDFPRKLLLLRALWSSAECWWHSSDTRRTSLLLRTLRHRTAAVSDSSAFEFTNFNCSEMQRNIKHATPTNPLLSTDDTTERPTEKEENPAAFRRNCYRQLRGSTWSSP